MNRSLAMTQYSGGGGEGGIFEVRGFENFGRGGDVKSFGDS
jgi:hypothetical protein